MNSPLPEPIDVHSETFLRRLMRGQLKLSIACAAVFLSALFGLPLLNYFFPEFMATRVFGFTLTWLILGVLFFPFVWVISYCFIKRSIALEEAEAEEVEKHQTPTSNIQRSTSEPSPKSAAGLLLLLGALSFSGAWWLVLGA
jgi:uncharacterized membrane protein (DUF485 family)